jgi:alcohol dehydrogenase
VPARDLPRYLDLYRQGRLPVDRLMTGRLTLEQIIEGFNCLHEGRAMRQVIAF